VKKSDDNARRAITLAHLALVVIGIILAVDFVSRFPYPGLATISITAATLLGLFFPHTSAPWVSLGIVVSLILYLIYGPEEKSITTIIIMVVASILVWVIRWLFRPLKNP